MATRRTLYNPRRSIQPPEMHSDNIPYHNSERTLDETMPPPKVETGLQRFCRRFNNTYCPRCQNSDCFYRLMVSNSSART